MSLRGNLKNTEKWKNVFRNNRKRSYKSDKDGNESVTAIS